MHAQAIRKSGAFLLRPAKANSLSSMDTHGYIWADFWRCQS